MSFTPTERTPCFRSRWQLTIDRASSIIRSKANRVETIPGGISHHAKDILFKSLSALYQNQALDVYGLHGLPRIKALLPNEFPSVRADERRADTVFLLEDDSILLLEYESNERFLDNHLKYLDYACRILHTYYQQEKRIRPIHIVVIYTIPVKLAV